ncbi:MAG: PKD domain-containing protein [Candidatus Bathyarchaeota archaeon]
MKTLNIIYWSRVGFGILAALVATLLVNLKAGNPLLNGITIALAVYLISYYLLKWRFTNKVEQPTKILTMGIGAFFLTFVLCWVLFITPFLAAPIPTFTITPENPTVGDAITFDAILNVDQDRNITKYIWDFGDENPVEAITTNYSYDEAGNYTIILTVVDDYGISLSNVTTITVAP